MARHSLCRPGFGPFEKKGGNTFRPGAPKVLEITNRYNWRDSREQACARAGVRYHHLFWVRVSSPRYQTSLIILRLVLINAPTPTSTLRRCQQYYLLALYSPETTPDESLWGHLIHYL